VKTSHRAILRPILLTAAAAVAFAGFLPAPAAQAAAATYRIAILGDSWASGEGNDPYAAGTGTAVTGCHRSLNAWAYQVVLPDGHTVRTDYDNGTASVQFLACQGATTSNITDFSLHGEGPQLDRMFSTVTHVFVSISGNDLDFASILTQCALKSAVNCQPVADRARNVGIPAAIANLKQTMQKVHLKAPTAEIVLTGYAPVVSSNSLLFTSSYGVLRDLALDFVAAQKAAVGVLDNTMNIKFADIAPTFAGHADGAPNNESWFYGFEYDSRTASGVSTRTLHPNALGEVGIAKVATTKVLKPFSCPTLVKSGATGECVKQVQRSLNAWNSYTTKLSFAALTIDGDFGPATLAAVKAFQKYRGLTADGIVGPATKADLFDK
jgi:hypothetical protein